MPLQALEILTNFAHDKFALSVSKYIVHTDIKRMYSDPRQLRKLADGDFFLAHL